MSGDQGFVIDCLRCHHNTRGDSINILQNYVQQQHKGACGADLGSSSAGSKTTPDLLDCMMCENVLCKENVQAVPQGVLCIFAAIAPFVLTHFSKGYGPDRLLEQAVQGFRDHLCNTSSVRQCRLLCLIWYFATPGLPQDPVRLPQDPGNVICPVHCPADSV